MASAHSDTDDTNPYDMTTYAYVDFKMESLHLFCLWAITPLKNGCMLNLSRFDGEQERIFIPSSLALDQLLSSITDWATAKSQIKPSSIPPK